MNSKTTTSPSRHGFEPHTPEGITKFASKQTYYTFRLLVPPARLQDAFRSYAYFRWVDDRLDSNDGNPQEKLSFLRRQQALLEASYRQESPAAQCPEEQMLTDLVAQDHEISSGLQFYLRNMMAVMAFDVQRRERWITQAQLTHYSHLLSTAVTELLFHFIAHGEQADRTDDRYQAVRGAHIAHMLRDMLDDIEHGYINLPAELLESQQISLDGLDRPAFRSWVKERVKLAHRCFDAGQRYFNRVKSLRCRLAAWAYLARFEWMLGAIERDGYRLRRAYPERKSLRAALWMGWRVLRSIVIVHNPERSDGQVALPEYRIEK